jgi:hypothetical protein
MLAFHNAQLHTEQAKKTMSVDDAYIAQITLILKMTSNGTVALISSTCKPILTIQQYIG